jgi:hypothetical protein
MDCEALRRVRQITEELDTSVPEKEAGVAIMSPPGPIEGHELCVVANRLGYLRLAIGLLKAAVEEGEDDSPDRPKLLEADVGQLIVPKSRFRLLYLERSEDLDRRRWGAGRWVALLFGSVCAAVALIALALLVAVLLAHFVF